MRSRRRGAAGLGRLPWAAWRSRRSSICRGRAGGASCGSKSSCKLWRAWLRRRWGS
uniref:Uncharacterized protein n=1 Tax=Arundo donax TaxID=35708 RepID=A0A0A9B1T7_ARUDO